MPQEVQTPEHSFHLGEDQNPFYLQVYICVPYEFQVTLQINQHSEFYSLNFAVKIVSKKSNKSAFRILNFAAKIVSKKTNKSTFRILRIEIRDNFCFR